MAITNIVAAARPAATRMSAPQKLRDVGQNSIWIAKKFRM